MMKVNCSTKQSGAVVPLVTILLPVLLLAAGWALDFGHAFVNKTRLQNGLDAAALSAAIVINRDAGKDIGAATTQGRKTFDIFKAASGNNEISDLRSNDLKFEYSKYIKPFVPGETDKPAFVRVSLIDKMKVTPILIRIFAAFDKDISIPATATAGAVGNNCSVTPFVMCIAINPMDRDCSDDGCYGYTYGSTTELSMAHAGELLRSGIYSLLDLDELPGNKDIYDALAAKDGDPGYRNICVNKPLSTDPNYSWDEAYQGINDRFDSDTDTVVYDGSGDKSAHTQYEESGKGNNRRMMVALAGYCSGQPGGKINIFLLGSGGGICVFLIDKPGKDNKKVKVEMVRSCPISGPFNPAKAVLNGPYKIVLFRSEKSSDS
jgi:hypothetical protein